MVALALGLFSPLIWELFVSVDDMKVVTTDDDDNNEVSLSILASVVVFVNDSLTGEGTCW